MMFFNNVHLTNKKREKPHGLDNFKKVKIGWHSVVNMQSYKFFTSKGFLSVVGEESMGGVTVSHESEI